MGVRQAVVMLRGADRPNHLQGIGPFESKEKASEWLSLVRSQITPDRIWVVELGNPDEISKSLDKSA